MEPAGSPEHRLRSMEMDKQESILPALPENSHLICARLQPRILAMMAKVAEIERMEKAESDARKFNKINRPRLL